MSTGKQSIETTTASVVALMLVAIALVATSSLGEAKLLRRSRYYNELPYEESAPYGSGATGERAIVTVRGARSPYDGSAPSKIAIEDNPYRGPYPRGVYDRLDGYGGAGRYPMGRPMGGLYPRPDPYSGYGNGYGGGYGGNGHSMFGAPSRIAVTGAFPYGYGAARY